MSVCITEDAHNFVCMSTYIYTRNEINQIVVLISMFIIVAERPKHFGAVRQNRNKSYQIKTWGDCVCYIFHIFNIAVFSSSSCFFLLMCSSWSGFWYGMHSVAHNTNPKNRLSRFPFLRQSETSERQIEAPNHWITRWHVFMFTSFTLIYTNGNNNSFVYLETMANVAAFRVA